MLVTFLCILFSKELCLGQITIPMLFNWYMAHPICFLWFIYELIVWAKTNVNVNIRKD